MSWIALSQNESIPLNSVLTYPFESSLYKKQEGNFHTGVRPFLAKDIAEIVSDSLFPSFGFRIAGGGETKSNLKLSPLVNIGVKVQSNTSMRTEYGAGVYGNWDIGSKLSLSGFYRYTVDPRFEFQDSSVFMGNYVNGIGKNLENDNAHHYEVYLSYSPNKFFSFTLGNGKHFWGDGYRSLMLSENAAPYPFLRIMSSFWHVRYTNLYAMHTDYTYNGSKNYKFTSSHQLSWNIVKNLNLTIFESVIFSAKDTLINRGFDVNYLNPIVFYRPVEYAQGSSDNVLLGASMKYSIFDKYVLYGQLVLDEFLLSAYRDNQNWWANKYAVQLGFKTYDLANIKNLSFQTELNFVRPFTYSHQTSLLNYGSGDQSLAHPLGANFQEVVTRLRYATGKWYFEGKTIYIDRGEDFDAVSYGGDIFRSYSLRADDYGHTIGQGESHFIWFNELSVVYAIVPQLHLNAFATYTIRTDRSNGVTNTLHLLQIGVRTQLWNTYSDY